MATRMREQLRSLAPTLRIAPTPKRVRALLGGVLVADTTRALLVWEPRRVVPGYAVPESDLRATLAFAGGEPEPDPSGVPPVLQPGRFTPHLHPGQSLSVRVGDRERAGAAFRADDADLAGWVILDFGAFDWLEEDEPVLSHPHDPFSRIDILASTRRVTVSLDGVTLADSSAPRLLVETSLPPRWYLPPEDVRRDLLTPSDTRTTCAYKGHATYWSLAGGGPEGVDLAWTYREPLHEAERVRGYVCFFAERTDLRLDGEPQERPVTFWSRPAALR